MAQNPSRRGRRQLVVALVVCCAVTLLGAVLSPDRSVRYAHDASPTWIDRTVHGMGLSLGDLVNRTKFAIIIDCGSSGSRLHAYSFRTGAVGIDIIDELFLRIKPGLGHYAGRPAQGAASLQPLLGAALAYVPRSEHATTRMLIGATAGLRVLPGNQADDLLNAVRKIALRTPFTISPTADVFMMSGSAEGAWAWLAVIFLLRRIGGPSGAAPRKKPVSVLDLGGGSIQMVRSLGTGREPEGSNGHRVATGSGKSHRVFAHSYLGLGLLASRMAVLESVENTACIPTGAYANFTFEGRTVKYGGSPWRKKRRANAAACVHIVQAFLKSHHWGCAHDAGVPSDVASGAHTRGGVDGTVKGAAEGAPKDVGCFFPGEARPGANLADEYFLMSFFNDRVMHAGAAHWVESAGEWRSSPNEMRAAADLHCSDPVATRDDADDNFRCMDMLFMSELLTMGFKLAAEQVVTVFENQKRGGKTFEGSWCLGAALELVLEPFDSRARVDQANNTSY